MFYFFLFLFIWPWRLLRLILIEFWMLITMQKFSFKSVYKQQSYSILKFYTLSYAAYYTFKKSEFLLCVDCFLNRRNRIINEEDTGAFNFCPLKWRSFATRWLLPLKLCNPQCIYGLFKYGVRLSIYQLLTEIQHIPLWQF